MTTQTINVTTSDLPNIMCAVQATAYGDIDQVLSVNEGVPVPTLATPPETGRLMGPYGPFLMIKVLSVSLAPGDWRVLSGKTRNVQGPPSFPYVPGGDCCGTVVKLPKDEDLPFSIGDRVAARFTGWGPRGALGEYAIIDSRIADKVPDSLSSDEAAALASASFAVPLADYIQPGDKRVLVLGAGGGLGSHVCQMIRDKGASYVVGVSSSPNRLLQAPLSYDEAIDYTKEDVLSLTRFQQEPFDVVIDLSCGGWPRLQKDVAEKLPLIIKTASQGGKYITTLTDKPVFGVSSKLEFLWKAIHPALWRALYSRVWTRSQLPTYSFAVLGPESREIMTRTLGLASLGILHAVTDERGPFPFTTEGVRAAFHVQESRHAHGKVVIHVSD